MAERAHAVRITPLPNWRNQMSMSSESDTMPEWGLVRWQENTA